MSQASLQVQLHSDLSNIQASAWNDLIRDENPFLEYEFLRNLEISGSVGRNTGWKPLYITAWQGQELQGALALYLKDNSYGEFIFDFEWARAHHQCGVPYYPKGIIAAPFTPVTGDRILLREKSNEAVQKKLITALFEVAEKRNLSSLHFLFLSETECSFLESQGFAKRLHYQFHWKNKGYRIFEDFLADLQHKRKNQILRERRRVQELGLKIEVLQGEAIQPEHLEAMWHLSARTFIQKSGDFPYLTEAFFQDLYKNFRHRTVMVMVQDGNKWVAGSINFRKGKHLYGRYWGTAADYPNLHFECCFYRLIDYAIAEGIELFEAGAQGEQKFFRGFGTYPTYSMHWIRETRLKEAIDVFLKEETLQVRRLIQNYNALSPLKALREQAKEGAV